MSDLTTKIKLASKDEYAAARAVRDSELEDYYRIILAAMRYAHRKWNNPLLRKEVAALSKQSSHETLADWMLSSYNNMLWLERFVALLELEIRERLDKNPIRGKAPLLQTHNRVGGSIPHMVHRREVIDEDQTPWAVQEFYPKWSAADWCVFVNRPIPPRRRRRREENTEPRMSRAQMRIEAELEKYPIYMRAKFRAKLERAERLRPKVKIRRL